MTPQDPVLEFIRVMWSVDHELQPVSKRMVSRITRSSEDTRRVHLKLSSRGQVVNRRQKGTVEAAVRRVPRR